MPELARDRSAHPGRRRGALLLGGLRARRPARSAARRALDRRGRVFGPSSASAPRAGDVRRFRDAMSELLFSESAHEYERERVTRALRDELPEAEPQGLRERAEALCAIREHYDVPFEVLILW